MNNIKVAVIGSTGYTGAELLRLLALQSSVELCYVSSRTEAGKPLGSVHPQLRNYYHLNFCEFEQIDFNHVDCVFFATPHGVAQNYVSIIWRYDHIKIIDLSADFRLKNQSVWEQYYQQLHKAPELIGQSVYGLPELNRQTIQNARLVACPGCYPTSVILGLLPILSTQHADVSTLIANCTSGISGAGRSASVNNLLAEMSENFKPYGIDNHRHKPEIEEVLSDIANLNVSLTFTPHLLPNIRGILSTLYVKLSKPCTTAEIQALYEAHYSNEPFVTVLPQGELPQTRFVRGTNQCLISVFCSRPDLLTVFTAEDNLCKGAAGQAIQCMNIMYSRVETQGLNQPALIP